MPDILNKIPTKTRAALRRVNGIVFVSMWDYVAVWRGSKIFLETYGYTPVQFKKDLRDNDPQAIMVAQELIAEGMKLCERPIDAAVEDGLRQEKPRVSLGLRAYAISFHRLRVEERTSVCGSVIPNEIRVL